MAGRPERKAPGDRCLCGTPVYDRRDPGGTPEENAAITRAILSGEKGHKRNAALLSAGAGLYLNDKAGSFREGVALAEELVDTGKAKETLEKLIEVSNRPEEEV